MNQNAEAITILCSYVCADKDVQPLTSTEWSKLAHWLREHNLDPKDVLKFGREDFTNTMNCTPQQADRMLRLIGRSASLSFELSRYETIGIQVVTRADSAYPKQLKRVLGNNCPPLFYCAGDLALLDQPCVGYAGSRAAPEEVLDFTAQTVRKTFDQGFGVVSGGAHGVDSAAQTEILQLGGWAVVYIATSLMSLLKKNEFLQPVQNGQLILLSAVKPNARFTVGAAMSRNRLIYGQSHGTVVVRSDLDRGGTWAGAMECLTHGWCPVFCWNNPAYVGNLALIDKGAIPIDAEWTGNVRVSASQNTHEKHATHTAITPPDNRTEYSVHAVEEKAKVASAQTQWDMAPEMGTSTAPTTKKDGPEPAFISPAYSKTDMPEGDAAVVNRESDPILDGTADSSEELRLQNALNDSGNSAPGVSASGNAGTQMSFFAMSQTD